MPIDERVFAQAPERGGAPFGRARRRRRVVGIGRGHSAVVSEIRAHVVEEQVGEGPDGLIAQLREGVIGAGDHVRHVAIRAAQSS
jgi:hypothetical protein